MAGRWYRRLEELLADGTDYLSNRDTFWLPVLRAGKKEQDNFSMVSACVQKSFGRMETDKRYSIVSCKKSEEMLLSFIKCAPGGVI